MPTPPLGSKGPPAAEAPPRAPHLGNVVMDDLRRGDFGRTVKRDLRALYQFYLDDEHREKLAAMNPFARWAMLAAWIVRAMFMNLSPARRLMLLAAFVLLAIGVAEFRQGDTQFTLDVHPLGAAVILLVLALELKDKLLARDELAIGRQVQTALLPKHNPELAGWDIWLYTRPANDVGGDLVDYMELRPGVLGLILGDVAGKGLGAALLMSKLQSTIRALASDTPDLVAFAKRVNGIFCRDGLPNRFATLAFLELSDSAANVQLLNAGHLPPYVLRAGRVESLDAVAPPIGLFEDSRFVAQSVELQPGDVLLVNSDGLTEARNARDEFFGDVVLGRLLPALRSLPAAKIGERLLREVELFVGDEPYADDLSLVIVVRKGDR